MPSLDERGEGGGDERGRRRGGKVLLGAAGRPRGTANAPGQLAGSIGNVYRPRSSISRESHALHNKKTIFESLIDRIAHPPPSAAAQPPHAAPVAAASCAAAANSAPFLAAPPAGLPPALSPHFKPEFYSPFLRRDFVTPAQLTRINNTLYIY